MEKQTRLVAFIPEPNDFTKGFFNIAKIQESVVSGYSFRLCTVGRPKDDQSGLILLFNEGCYLPNTDKIKDWEDFHARLSAALTKPVLHWEDFTEGQDMTWCIP